MSTFRDLLSSHESLAQVPLGLDIASVALGAVQGAVFASRMADERKLDLNGLILVGVATGLGGGIIRDILLNQTPAALQNPWLLTAAIVAALLGMTLAPLINRLVRLVVAVDAAALGMYLMVGTAKANDRGLGTVPVMFVGFVSCVGGSAIRDMLLQVQVAIMRVGSFYGTAAVLGGAAFSVVEAVSNVRAAGFAAVGVTFAARMAAVRWGWSAPRAQVLSPEKLRKIARAARYPNGPRA